jgi:hypothetical protein
MLDLDPCPDPNSKWIRTQTLERRSGILLSKAPVAAGEALLEGYPTLEIRGWDIT